MSSDVEICNLALSRLGARRIESFDDQTDESNECLAVYSLVTKQVQAKGPWMCQKLRVTLPQVTAPPTFGFAFAYQLPVNPLCLRVLKINETDINDSGSIDFQVENNLLLCDETSVKILYMGLIADSQAYDPYLEEAVVDALVAQMALKFMGSEQYQAQATKYMVDNRKELLTLSSLQGTSDTIHSTVFTEIRFAESSNGANSAGSTLSTTGDQGVDPLGQ